MPLSFVKHPDDFRSVYPTTVIIQTTAKLGRQETIEFVALLVATIRGDRTLREGLPTIEAMVAAGLRIIIREEQQVDLVSMRQDPEVHVNELISTCVPELAGKALRCRTGVVPDVLRDGAPSLVTWFFPAIT